MTKAEIIRLEITTDGLPNQVDAKKLAAFLTKHLKVEPAALLDDLPPQAR